MPLRSLAMYIDRVKSVSFQNVLTLISGKKVLRVELVTSDGETSLVDIPFSDEQGTPEEITLTSETVD